MQATTIEKGQDAEELACRYLGKQGLKLVSRNYRCVRGEIDIIMEHDNSIVFIEVRFRKDSRYGTGAETVTRTKQAKLITTAMHYLQNNPRYSNRPSRFDVVSITGQSSEPQIDWITDAFQN